MEKKSPASDHRMMTIKINDKVVKKRHTVKILTLTNNDLKILYMSPVFSGSAHDYMIMKKCLPPHISWFEGMTLRADLGFLGAVTDYGRGADIRLPHKRPKRSKVNRHPRLTKIQQRANRHHSSIRVLIEHAIAGIKSFHCLTHRIRNQSSAFIDQFFGLASGLWNYKIS
ncbi:hypothetical protein CKO25_11620 [Thiocapsa imhoffii]|uniref:DDE Tnp4 domain-containing protein n=1 Tax=Thiocapsa imhoffii TaxID=382777 RepID=A0A9X1B9R1_9GAMM|nr:transposase family protein [Thiocapsa imhoffii]MBK1645276.1 hypothetical protein [Thiocapsa imhoffii]